MNPTIVRAVIAAAALTLFGAVYAQSNPQEHCAAESPKSCCATASSADSHAGHTDQADSGTGASTQSHAQHEAAAIPDAATGHTDHAMPACCSGKDGMGMRGGGMGAVMPDAMRLLHNHGSLERKVEDIPGGVKTTTTTSDPALLALLRRHPRDMYSHYEAGGMVRPHDPLFGELSRVADKVSMEFRDVENGIEVLATSQDPEVAKLIRSHAYKVSEFVKRGHAALHEGAPLPEDYHPAK